MSTLWFCLTLNSLSATKGFNLGYRFHTEDEINSRLLYMDDLKLFASNKPDLMFLLNVTQKFSNESSMEFSVDKCVVIHVRRASNSKNIQLPEIVYVKSL